MNTVTSFFTLANFLTLSRIGLIPFLFIAIEKKNAQLTLLLFCLGGLTDLFDGLCARSFNETSKFGELLDPIADKLFFAGFFIALLLSPQPLFVIPEWFLLLLFARDLFLLITGFFILQQNQPIKLNPRFLGKLCTAWIMLTSTVLLIEKCFLERTNTPSNIAPFLWNIAGILLISSWIDYLHQGIIALKKKL